MAGYGELMDGEGQQETQDSGGYGALMDQEKDGSRAAIAQSVSMAVGADPERKARVIELSKKTNMPADLVERNYDELNKQHAVESMNYAELMDKNPGLSESLKDQNFAAVAHDDIDQLKKLEDSVKEYGVMTEAYDRINKGLDHFYSGVAKWPAAVYQGAATLQNLFMKAIGKPERQVTAPDWLLNNPVAKYYDKAAESFNDQRQLNESVTKLIGEKQWGKVGRSLAMQFLENFPTQAALIASHASGLGVAGLAGAGLSSAGESLKETSDKREMMMTEGGPMVNPELAREVDPAMSAISAVGKGSIEAVFESLGTFSVLKEWEKAIARNAGREASRQIFKDFGKTLLYSVAAEGNEEMLTSYEQDFVDYITGTNPEALFGAPGRALDAGIHGGFSGGFLSAPGGAAIGRARQKQARKAQLYTDFLTSLGDDVQKSKLRERLPEGLKEYAERLTKGTPVENVFIPVEAVTTYLQGSKDPATVLNEMGIAHEYDQAKETGQDIQIPLATWVDKTVGTPHYKAFLNDVKHGEQDQSVNEIKKINEEMKAEADKVAAEQKTKIETEAAEVKKSVTEQLVATGKYNQADANTAAELWGNFFRTASENSSVATVPGFGQVTPKQLYDKYIGKILAGEAPTEGMTLNQDAKKDPALIDVFKEAGVEYAGDFSNLALFNDPETKSTLALPKEGLTVEKIKQKIEESRNNFKTFKQSPVKLQSNELGFYHKIQNTISEKMGNTATVEQVRGIIKEMKPEEIKWSGIDEFLKGKEKVSKTELLDYLMANQVEIKEVVRSSAKALDWIDGSGESLFETADGEFWITENKPETNRPYKYTLNQKGHGVVSNSNSSGALKESAEKYHSDDQTKFSQYTLPGGENYREVLLTMPPSENKLTELPEGYTVKSRVSETQKDYNGNLVTMWDVYGPDGRPVDGGATKEVAIKNAISRLNERSSNDNNFKSSHFDEPNVLAHVRLNERTDADGKKVLFVEEIQSDWHQAGRKKGYKSDQQLPPGYKVEKNNIPAQYEKNPQTTFFVKDTNGKIAGMGETQEAALKDYFKVSSGAVPDAPLKKTWHEFAMKRIIRMAAEQGFDKVAWTTGEQQAERYDLSKQIDAIEAYKTKDGTFDIEILKDKRIIIEKDGVKPDDLSDIVGKDLADKIINESGKETKSGFKRYDGLDLKVGGEGMKGFYDKILVDAANKLGKKFGAKVGETDISVSEGPTDEISFMVSKNPDEQWAVFKSIASGSSIPEEVSTHKTKAEAKTEAARLNSEYVSESKNTKVHSLDITPELKNAAINEGFSLFQPGPDEPRGSATFDKNRNVIINLFKTADLSTFLHESGHVFLEIMGDLAQADGAPTKVKDDYSSLLKWLGVESRDQIKTEHHEQLARGFEAYLMEGKAPTQALRSAFAQIKTWLLAIYKSAKKLDVELNDDIRNVFDRWLATEQEIEAANREVNYEPLFKDPAGFGMSGPQAERYQKAIDDSRMAAEEQLAARLISDFERRKTAQYKERFKIIAGEIETQANEMNVYKLLYALQKNTKPDGSPLPDGMPTQIKIDRESATKEFGYNPNRLPTRVLSTIKDGGFHPSQLAEMFGFENGDALLRELANSVPKKDYIEREANNRIKQEFPDIYEDGKIHDEAVKYIHNNMKSKLMLMELEHMATNHLPAMKDVIKKIARRVPTEKAVREQAVKIIADRKITDIRPHLFLRAEAKAAKESGILFTKGDFEGAFNAKRRELLNHELYRAAIEAQEDIDKSQDKFKRLFKPDEKIAKSRDMDYVNAARAILAQYGLAKTDKTAAQYIKPIMDYDPDTYQAVAAIIDSATQNAGPWEQIKYDDYVAVKDAVISLWALAKTSKEIEIDGKRESRDEAMAFLTARIAELSKTDQKAEYTRSKTKWEKSKLMLMGTRSALRRVESWIDSMDGTAGKMFRKYIWNPVKESETNYKIAKLPLIKKFLEIVKPIEQTLVKKEIIAHELLDNRGRKYVFRSKAELLGAILHTGNDSNLSKLLRGYGWGQFNDDGSLDRRRWDSFVKRMWDEGVLTKADYDVMQATWDLMESIKPEAQKAHKKMYGHYFSEVTANEIVTPWGVYRGGYVPAKVDPNNPQASARQDKENLEKNGNSYAFPTTGRGATKTRVEAYAAPLMMDLNLIPAHIDWAMRFIHIEPAIKDVSKILLNREFQSRLNEFDQTAMSDMLVPWLQRTGQQKVSMPSQGQAGRMLDTVSKFLRRNSGMAIMFGNVLNTAQQFTGVLPATIKVKQRFLRNALWALTRSPAKTAEMINEKSKFMQTRSGNQLLDVQKDINDLLLNPSKYERFTDFTQKHAYFMQGFTQGVVDSVVWVGAYDQAVENGLDEKEAVREADSAVRLTQGSFDASDVSRYSTGSPFQRLFTMFFDYFNMLGNLMGTEYATTMREMGLKKGAGRMLYVYVFAFMGTAVISEAIMKLGGGKLDEDDDDEYMDDFISMFFGSQFRTLTAMLPGGSAVTNYVSNKFSDKRVFDDRISLSPSIKMIEQTVNAPFSIYEAIANDGSEKKAVRDVLTAVSLLSGIPVAPLARPIGYQIDVNEGNASPSGPIDYTRGLVTGRSSQ